MRLLLVAIGVLCSTAALAQEEPENNVPKNRDKTINRHLGFFLRLDLGGGYLTASEPTNGPDNLTISGLAGAFGFGIGGAVAENTILSFHLYDGVALNPNVSLGSSSGSTNNSSLTMIGYGLGITQYVMPANVYVSVTPALTRISATANGNDSTSNWGFGGSLALGKEWWVSDHWGLGIVAHVDGSWNTDSGSGKPTLTTYVLGLSFSATFN